MPIEIRELHIKAVIDSGGAGKSTGPAATAGDEKSAGSQEQTSDQLIDICVEKVLEILKEKMER